MTGSFAIAIVVMVGLFSRQPDARSFTQVLFTWVPVGAFHTRVSLLVDPLSMTMALFVCGVSALIHLYSIGYMAEDSDYAKFFVYLNLFVASMLILVLAGNLLLTFVGWEGVGLCSYFLIAFWYDRDSAASAGKKAFIVNRIGDFGFLVAMFLVFTTLGTLNFHSIFAHAHQLSGSTATAITLLLFLAATGKSAQFPLFTWLPDAMEGPTPVSALIHAATMVTAGVYLMVRVAPLLHIVPNVGLVIAVVGVVTAFVAASIACAQDDIKKVIAYSTVSQIGYMMLAVGVGAYVAAIFLMVAHAFYKSTLFLAAGSVIHSLHDEQDIKRMGGLRRYLPWTYGAFLIAWLSIAGVPPFSAFWAKGDILDHAFGYNHALWALGALTAILTAYYIGREFFLVFHGKERWRELGVLHGGGEPHESPWVMRLPVVVLAALAAVAGLLNLPFHPDLPFLSRWLAPVVAPFARPLTIGVSTEWVLAITDSVLALIGVGIAFKAWIATDERPVLEPEFLRKGWFIDESYDLVIARSGTEIAGLAATEVERKGIDGAVSAVATLVKDTGSGLRRLQTGYLRNYAIGIVVGLVGMLAWMLSRVGS